MLTASSLILGKTQTLSIYFNLVICKAKGGDVEKRNKDSNKPKD